MMTMVAGTGGYYIDNSNPHNLEGYQPTMCTPPQHSSPLTTTPTNSTITTTTSNTSNTSTTHVTLANMGPVPQMDAMLGYPQGPPPPYGSEYYGNSGEYYPGPPPEYCHTSLCTLHTVPGGPATIRMVSTNSSPPIPMPVQVPPGHVVQQIVDETGTLQHLILSTQPLPMPMYQCPPNGQGPFYGPPPPGPPQSYIPPYQPPGYTPVMSPPLTQPSPPPPMNYPQKPHPTSRTKFDPLRPKFLPRHQQPINGQTNKSSANSSLHSTPPLSPQKENLGSTNKDMEDDPNSEQISLFNPAQIRQILSRIKNPEMTGITPRSAIAQWYPLELMPNEREAVEESMAEVEYEVFLNNDRIAMTNDTKLQLKDLSPGQEYRVHLLCRLPNLEGEPGPLTRFCTLCDKPEAPSPIKVIEKTKTSLLCKWTHTRDNGSRILTYVIETSENGKGCWNEVFRGGRCKQYNINKLKPQTTYQIRIAAINELGQSGWSIETVCSTCGVAPKQPTRPTLEKATISSLSLGWKRVSREDFVLQMEDCQNDYGFLNVYNGADTKFTCKDLRRNTDYRFRLCSWNEDGTSPYSDPACYRTLPDRPHPPSPPFVKGRPHANRLTLMWNPPYDDGGSPVTNYKIEMDRGNEYVLTYDGPNRECECTELTPGTSYRVRAQASSIGGDSDWSASAIVNTEPVCPKQCRPPQPLNKPKASTIQLKWSPPDNNGGSAITEYHLDMTSADNDRRQVYCGRDTQCTVASLLPGRHYIFLVRAVNRIGLGAWSEPLEVVSGAGPPDVPYPPHLACRGPQTVQVTWDEPINNGAGIESFTVQLAEVSNPCIESSETSSSCGDIEPDLTFSNAFVGPAPNKSTEIKNLLPATTYAFRLNATNSAGTGPWSNPSQVTTPAAAPGVVSYVSLTTLPTQITLHWTEPPNHGDPITHYIIDVSDNNSITTEGPELEYTVSQLNPETSYKFRIQAVNSVGTGALSSTHKAVTRALPPSPPTIDLVKASYNSLRLKWGDNRNTDMLKYCLQMEFLNPISKSMEFYQVYSGTNHNHRVSKLEEMTCYRLRISASNEAGEGAFSEPYEFYTSKAPPSSLKEAPRVTPGPESTFCIEWCGVKSPSEDQINYRLQVQKAGKDQDYSIVYYGVETSYVLSNLEPNSGYYVRVCGVRISSDGDTMAGPYSSPTLFNTPPLASLKSADNGDAAVQDKCESLWVRMTDKDMATIMSFTFFVFCGLIAFGVSWYVTL